MASTKAQARQAALRTPARRESFLKWWWDHNADTIKISFVPGIGRNDNGVLNLYNKHIRPVEPGWWWSRRSGCLADAGGPFESEQAARDDVQRAFFEHDWTRLRIDVKS